jgi:hypothetical protein
MIIRIRKLELLDEEAIQEFDRELAEQFFISNRSKH